MTTVLVAASSPVVRAGLEAIARSSGNVRVIGAIPLGEAAAREVSERSPDVVLAEVESHGLDLVNALSGAAIVLLTDEPALPLIRAGAKSVLPHGTSAAEIGLAIEAAAAGLIVTHPDALGSPTEAAAIPAAPAGPLTVREIEVLRMLSEGLANKEIAWRLRISEHTVKFHVSSLFHKLNASSRTEAVTLGVRQGLILL